jgi:hypothetical protein
VKECTILNREKQEIQAENAKLKKAPPCGLSESVKKDAENKESKIAEGEKNLEEKEVSARTENVNQGDGGLVEEKATLFELKLDEAQKTLLAERG